jgi:hypothetical protein
VSFHPKKGTKQLLLVNGREVRLSFVVTGANRYDVSQLELILDEIIIERPGDSYKVYEGKIH